MTKIRSTSFARRDQNSSAYAVMKNNKNKASFPSSTSRFRKYFPNSCSARSTTVVYIIAQIAFLIDRSAVSCTHIGLKRFRERYAGRKRSLVDIFAEDASFAFVNFHRFATNRLFNHRLRNSSFYKNDLLRFESLLEVRGTWNFAYLASSSWLRICTW